MLKLAIGMQIHKSKKGFTLIEILIVLVIISIIISVAMLSFGDFGERRKAIYAAEHFVYFAKLVKKEAMLSNQVLAIKINKDHYSVVRFKNNHWQPLENSIYKKHTLPANLFLFLAKQSTNMIIINPDGRIIPFKLHFGNNKNNIIATVINSSQDLMIINNAK